MFTVPGWNVSAPIAAQVEQPKPQDPNKLGKKALKRKRAAEKQQVNTEDLGKLWEKAEAQKVETKKAEAKKTEAPKAAQASTDADLPARALQRAAEDAAEAAAEGETKSKKRKRGPRKNAATREAAAAKAAEAGVAADAVPAGPKVADPDSKRSKKKQKKEAKAQKAEKAAQGDDEDTPAAPKAVEVPALMDPVALIPEPAGLTPLQKSMRSKLASARFRHLNESLYTKPSADSLSLFREDPSMFEDYHRGFAQQVEVWPQNPVDDYVASILARGSIKIAKDPWRAQMRDKKKKGPVAAAAEPQEEDARPVIPRGNNKPLPRTHGSKCLIADLGCGVASLSYRLQPHLASLNIDIKSFDLSQPSGPSKNLVTIADISALPLADNSTDIAIFCLALMGTNWLDFIDEAYRVLRWKGELWVAEIKSRFGRVEKKKNIPINSIGSLNKGGKVPPKKKGPKEKKKDDVEGIEDSADEQELAQTVDGASGPEGTDVSSFVEVLRSRGFVLDALPERPGDAIDLNNKMFVKLQFVKGAQPTKGKNAGTEGTSAGAKGSFKTSSALKMGMKGKKFSAVNDEDGEASEKKDAATLKPCLYKIR
ncbi:25S rRNA (adenine645-N1)-methyltransferase [Curvularia kusanoi]|uniref:Ribosomal RNA-processing protein 8 n=1 Tax=Curvularia kusanoi TaxID=90978 RepID=A0A9P4T4S9_CURKU|nr:25S rRNA (adenine645-N1)-methyltransferase [Curvularia kusanoi]